MKKQNFIKAKKSQIGRAKKKSSQESRFLNRELGWLKFNKRVLYQAIDNRNPLLERVKFYNIFQSNLDEFFMKRVGGLKRQLLAGVATLSQDGLTPEQQLRKIRKKVLNLNLELSDLLFDKLIPKLKKERIRLCQYKDLSPDQKNWVTQYFQKKVFPVLTPMAVDLGHPFPHISNLSLSLAVALRAPHEKDTLFARIKIPNIFPPWVSLPKSGPSDPEQFISVLDIAVQHIDQLFPKMKIVNVMPFRITRNVDLDHVEEGVEDLLELIEENVRQRKFADVVRLEHGPKPDPWLLQFLVDEMELQDDDVFQVPFKLDLLNLTSVAALNRPDLKYPSWTPTVPGVFQDQETPLFQLIRNQDVLVHHPYESFAGTVEKFLAAAANDPMVVAIKMTLYRTSEDSSILQSLVRAAEFGKQVVVLIELKARFDEERNIQWAQLLERAGAHVVYGILGLKTHAKLALVIRKEKEEFQTYAHIGTGNYHPVTAKLYTDLGLFTARPEITAEVVDVFHYLTGRSLKSDYSTLLVAPINLKKRFLDLIAEEIQAAKLKKPSGIIIKCNSLEDRDCIEALYAASAAGVPVQLIVRGFCCLRPQVSGLSENIDVISLIGPFLEHSRIFYFRGGQDRELDGHFFIGSPDWMSRNLLGRVEVVTPIFDATNREKLWKVLQTNLQDQRLVWDMKANGDYILREPSDPQVLGSHDSLVL